MYPFSVIGIILLTAIATMAAFQFLIWKRQGSFIVPEPDLSPVQAQVDLLRQAVEQTDRNFREEFSRLRQELTAQSQAFRQSVEQRLEAFSAATNQKMEFLRSSLAESGGRLQSQVSQELERLQAALNLTAQQSRTESSGKLTEVSESLVKSVADSTAAQEIQLDKIRSTVELRLSTMSHDNEKRLEQMRQTVDEKLQGTLEARLGESFKLVSDRLEQVHKGLGEMQTLASGVGDLKRVLTNVRTRGTWGEVRLGNLLGEILTVDQYEKNVSTTGTRERVEFAIKLPGREVGNPCWLPVDSKFPDAGYQRLLEASERGDPEGVEMAARGLEATLKSCARTISEKYLHPPETTDFGILFLPTEGLYAEALRRVGLAETLQREYRVVLAGPNTFAALLNSLHMGFRTLAVQQRSSEVWEVLGDVKTQFAKYADVLSKVKKKLQEASNTVDQAERGARALQSSLHQVESAPNGCHGRNGHLLDLAIVEDDGELALTDLRA